MAIHRSKDSMICCCAGVPGADFCGGLWTGGIILATIDNLNFSTQVTAAASYGLNTVRADAFGLGDANNHGYIAGGNTTTGTDFTPVSSAEKIDFSANTCTALTSALSEARAIGASVSERSTKGYFCGGSTNTISSNGRPVVTTDKVTFSNDSIAAVTTANLPTATWQMCGLTNGSTKGYVSGGTTDNSGVADVKTTDRITFSGDTIATLTGANLSLARHRLTGISNGSTAGYFQGGASFGPPLVALKTADKLTFSSETTAAKTSANLTTAKYAAGSASDGTTYGYVGGGFSSSPGGLTAKTDVLTFSSETCANVTSAQLTATKDGIATAATTGYG